MVLAEQTKRDRVGVILDAAERLIRAEEGTRFSMRALALEAGVSPATPFNLLGSKAKILEALFARSFALPQGAQPHAFDPRRSNALDYAFRICDWVMQRYAAEEAFYQTLLSGLRPLFDALLAGIANWRLVLQIAVKQGDLRADAPVQFIAETIELGISGTMAFWVTGDLASARLTHQTRFAVASTLVAFATAPAQPKLQKHIKAAARALRAQGPVGA